MLSVRSCEVSSVDSSEDSVNTPLSEALFHYLLTTIMLRTSLCTRLYGVCLCVRLAQGSCQQMYANPVLWPLR